MNDLNLSHNDTKVITLYKKGDYELFSEYFNNIDWVTSFTNKPINECYDIFLSHYYNATQVYIPVTRNSRKKGKSSWMTSELKCKIKRKNKLWLESKASNWRKSWS